MHTSRNLQTPNVHLLPLYGLALSLRKKNAGWQYAIENGLIYDNSFDYYWRNSTHHYLKMGVLHLGQMVIGGLALGR